MSETETQLKTHQDELNEKNRLLEEHGGKLAEHQDLLSQTKQEHEAA